MAHFAEFDWGMLLAVYAWAKWPMVAALAVYIIYRFIAELRTRPKLSAEEILHEEYFALGWVPRNLFPTIREHKDTLHLVVTSDRLFAFAAFPLLIFTGANAVRHVIPIRSITSVRDDLCLCFRSFLIYWRDEAGKSCKLRLVSKKPDEFAAAVRTALDNEVASAS
jgi:hypothetical protein